MCIRDRWYQRRVHGQAESAFYTYDRDRSGSLDMNEFYPAVCQVFQYLNHPPPSYYDVMYLFQAFDRNGDRRLSKDEFVRFLWAACRVQCPQRFFFFVYFFY
eukprot:TRINITY_DN2630_c0_g1_i2.p3 TRINITY_DN2630_c0_g1~~TRINITY_DN2630_c0_g1_i2.p3  ORF type:complete len:102 (+),score=20.36 TRINITY_DN2630_c0_g1_i2:65-370(+)